MNVASPQESKKQRTISAYWLMPVLAFCVSAWMIYKEYYARGPLVTIEFATAEGIVAGKTRIKALNVDIGTVESVRLLPTLKNVIVTVRLDKEIAPMLTDGARFWVVRPRIGRSGISGLDTILSGAYIEFSPGRGSAQSHFIGLEDVPQVENDTPGVHVRLHGDARKAHTRGTPVFFRGFKVGSVQYAKLDIESGNMFYKVFIEAPYHGMLNTNTRFWDTSGIELSTSSEGVKIRTASIESILAGGIAFDLPDGVKRGQAIENFHDFNLYRDREATLTKSYKHFAEYVILVEDSIRGLQANAPVEYRGVPVGRVTKTYMSYSDIEKISPMEDRIPILIRIEPARLGFEDSEAAVKDLQKNMIQWLKRGLKATLKSGNLLTGRMFVELDAGQQEQEMVLPLMQFDDWTMIPYKTGGLAQVQDKIFALLDKVEKLPVESTLVEASEALKSSQKVIEQFAALTRSLDILVSSEQSRNLPEELGVLLAQLQKTLDDYSRHAPFYREVNKLLRKLTLAVSEAQPLLRDLKTKPNSLIFDSGDTTADEQPSSQ